LVQIAEKFAEYPGLNPHLLGNPEVIESGIINRWAIKRRVMVKLLPEQRLKITLDIQKRVLQAYLQGAISLSFP
jgi:hypothetical protein